MSRSAPVSPAFALARRQTPRLARALCAGLFAAALVLGALPRPCLAKVQREVRYRYEQVWPTAIRYLRVDAGFKIVEKDADSGYVIFELAEEGKVFRGALELVQVEADDGHKRVRLVVSIEDRPTYAEVGVLDGLERKLRDEHGSPRDDKPADKPRE